MQRRRKFSSGVNVGETLIDDDKHLFFTASLFYLTKHNLGSQILSHTLFVQIQISPTDLLLRLKREQFTAIHILKIF